MQVKLAQVVAAVDTTGASNWIQDNLIQLALLVLAVVVLFASREGNFSKVVTIGACAVVGLAILGMGAGNNATNVGEWIVGLFVT